MAYTDKVHVKLVGILSDESVKPKFRLKKKTP